MANRSGIGERDAKGRIVGTKKPAGQSPNGNGDGAFVDSGTAATEAGEPAEPESRAKRRDAPSGNGSGGNKAGKASGASLDLSALAGVIQGFHAIIAFQRAEPHWLVNDNDAKRYSIAIGNALRHMQIRTAQKTIDMAALVFVAFSVETPRVIRSAQLARETANPRRQGPSATVFQFTNPPPTQPAPTTADEAPMAEGPPDYGNGAA